MGGLADPEKPLNLISQHQIPLASSCNPSNIEPILQTEDFFDEMNGTYGRQIDKRRQNPISLVFFLCAFVTVATATAGGGINNLDHRGCDATYRVMEQN